MKILCFKIAFRSACFFVLLYVLLSCFPLQSGQASLDSVEIDQGIAVSGDASFDDLREVRTGTTIGSSATLGELGITQACQIRLRYLVTFETPAVADVYITATVTSVRARNTKQVRFFSISSSVAFISDPFSDGVPDSRKLFEIRLNATDQAELQKLIDDPMIGPVNIRLSAGSKTRGSVSIQTSSNIKFFADFTCSVERPLLQFSALEKVYGFEKTSELSEGDQFLLSESLHFRVTTPNSQARINSAIGSIDSDSGPRNFFLQGIFPEAFSSVRAISSSLDSFRDLNFSLSEGETGDRLRLFLASTPDDGNPIELAAFVYGSDGIMLASLNENAGLYLDSRLKPESGRLSVNRIIPVSATRSSPSSFVFSTRLLTLSFSQATGSPVAGCKFLGVEIMSSSSKRQGGIIFEDAVVNRREISGDRERTRTGLIGKLTGGYPTGAACNLPVRGRVISPETPRRRFRPFRSLP